MKFSTKFTILGTIIALISLFSTSSGAAWFHLPFGADVIDKLSSLPAMVFAVFCLWLGSRALLDYLDLKAIADKASETPQGAGMVFIGVAINRCALAILILGMLSIFSS